MIIYFDVTIRWLHKMCFVSSSSFLCKVNENWVKKHKMKKPTTSYNEIQQIFIYKKWNNDTSTAEVVSPIIMELLFIAKEREGRGAGPSSWLPSRVCIQVKPATTQKRESSSSFANCSYFFRINVTSCFFFDGATDQVDSRSFWACHMPFAHQAEWMEDGWKKFQCQRMLRVKDSAFFQRPMIVNFSSLQWLICNFNWTFLSTPFKKRYAKKYELQSVNEEKTSLKRSFNCSSRNSLQHFRWHPRTIGVHKACVESGNSLLVSNFSNRSIAICVFHFYFTECVVIWRAIIRDTYKIGTSCEWWKKSFSARQKRDVVCH